MLRRRARTVFLLLKTLGPRWLAYRLYYALAQRLGVLEHRTPPRPWSAHPLRELLTDTALSKDEAYLDYRRHRAPLFFFAPDQQSSFHSLFKLWDAGESEVVAEAERVGLGILRYFSRHQHVTGFPPAWHHNPVDGETVSPDHHWSRIDDFGRGDIKLLWEPGRFGFAFTLVRAYWRTEDDRYAEWFWQCVEDWRVCNPPQLGVHWRCGQETTFRVMAWCFGLYGFLHAAATTEYRVSQLVEMIARSGGRIAANIDYALSQRNNHGISEAVGLWTIGLLFPELKEAATWRERGRNLLEQLAVDLIAPDGSFTQHSTNYHRVMLHDYLWALQLGDLNGQALSQVSRQRFSDATNFLYQIQDEVSGSAPNYGPNDGALILPLSSCSYQDFRPVVQSAWYYLHRRRCWHSGPWDEDLLWLFGTAAVSSPVDPSQWRSFCAADGGYYTLRSRDSLLFTRCGPFRSRPSHADLLHVDLWWRGQNIALDPGSFSYHAAPPWDGALADTSCHNTVSVDGLDQMERHGRFLWLPWARGRLLSTRETGGEISYWEGEHNGYHHLESPVRHRRAVLKLSERGWLILDALNSTGSHTYRLHWLLADLLHTWDAANTLVNLKTTGGHYFFQAGAFPGKPTTSLVRADPFTTRGWHAPYYNERLPALSFDLCIEAQSALLWSWFSPETITVYQTPSELQLGTVGWNTTLHLQTTSASPLITATIASGLSMLQTTDRMFY